MLCENYRQSLRDAVVAGRTLSAELRSHLDACADCRADFTREQILFSEIDSNLQLIANPDVPDALVPRMRMELAREPLSSRRNLSVWAWVPAFAAAIVALALFVPQLIRDFQSAPSPAIVVGPASPAASLRTVQPAAAPGPARSVLAVRSRRASPHALVAGAMQPKVLVPAGQETALAHYVALLQRQPGLAQVATEEKNQRPLHIEPLEIAELSGQPLTIEPLSEQ